MLEDKLHRMHKQQDILQCPFSVRSLTRVKGGRKHNKWYQWICPSEPDNILQSGNKTKPLLP